MVVFLALLVVVVQPLPVDNRASLDVFFSSRFLPRDADLVQPPVVNSTSTLSNTQRMVALEATVAKMTREKARSSSSWPRPSGKMRTLWTTATTDAGDQECNTGQGLSHSLLLFGFPLAHYRDFGCKRMDQLNILINTHIRPDRSAKQPTSNHQQGRLYPSSVLAALARNLGHESGPRRYCHARQPTVKA